MEGSYYSWVKVYYPVFLAQIKLENLTGYRLTTGNDLYLLQTATVPSGKKIAQVLEVIGGQFKESPQEDYVGVVEFRGRKATPDTEIGLIDSIDVDGRHGYFGGALAVLLSIGGGGGNILDRRLEKSMNFGAADSGRSLVIESNDLQLTVHVQDEFLSGIHLVSPRLELLGAKGEKAAFRYLFDFGKGSTAPSTTTLLAMDDDTLMPILQDPSEALWKRVLAAQWAGDLKSATSAEVLAGIAGNEVGQSIPLRRSAVLALGVRQAAIDVVQGIASNKKEPRTLRDAAVWALGRSSDPASVNSLLALLNDSDTSVKAQAIDALAARKASQALEPLVTLLPKREAADVRSNIATAIGELGDGSTADALLAAAKKTPDIQRLVIPVLMKLRSANTLPALAALFDANAPKGSKDENWPVRSDICEALSGVEDPVALEILKKGLTDSHERVRAAAVRSIAASRLPETISIALNLIDDPDKDKARATIRAFEGTGSGAAKGKILAVLKDHTRPKEVRWAAINALAEYHDAEVVQALIDALQQETDANLRAETLDALVAQESPKATAIIETFLRDSDDYVVGRAARLWRKMNGVNACASTLGALLESKDAEAASELVNMLTLPGCRGTAALEKVIGRLGEADAAYDAEIARLLKSWSSEDLGVDKEKWLAWLKQSSLT